ncbi:uncharacterized protein LOC128858295 isoform X2 [Anastrepha ludens]|uniref:uncharacterized protein LOC128858295 isoform X2 n=1 Tax=Anastrepha ludens TaxID=28586 RepID=UPI0023AF3A6B|nr:uncharacterized protein LOC128858295 isoform X2 [Anastrepha ludens]
MSQTTNSRRSSANTLSKGAASVAVSSWTLVAISCERYYAICHPLRSRTWQTINHAYRIIGFIWFGSIICMTPIAIFSQLIPTSRQGLRKCREQWPEDTIAYERSYNIFLDLALLVLPLFILCVAYILITRTLYVGMRAERALIFGGYATSNTPVKQHVGTSLPAISTVTGENAATATTALPPSVLRSFNLKMSLRCHRKPASVGSGAIRSDGQDIVSEMQSDMGYHQHRHHQHEQQQRQQEQQLKYYDDSGGGGDVLHKSFSIASTKTPQSLFGLRVLPCVDKVEQQKEMQPPTPPQQQQQLILLQTNIARHLHGYNSNGNHTANNSEGAILFANHHQPHQQNQVTLRANLPQYHSNQLNQQQQKQNLLSQVSLKSQQKPLIGDRRKTYSTPSIRIKESTLRRSNETKNLESKKRVVKMLFVLVLEFFICWTPLYVINTVAMFIGPAIYEYIDYTSICFFQLLAYSSSCCNPITYCFMNASFRRAFLDTFKGLHLSGNSGGAGGASVGIWHSRQKGTDCGVGGGSRSDAHLPALVTNDSIALANNAIIASNNTLMHGSQHPQRN